MGPDGLTGPVIAEFLVERRRGHSHLYSLQALGPVLGYLRRVGVAPAAEARVPVGAVEELLARFEDIEVVEEPEYQQSNFVRGYTNMQVVLTPRGQKRRPGPRKIAAPQPVQNRVGSREGWVTSTAETEVDLQVAGRREEAGRVPCPQLVGRQVHP